MYDIKLRHPVGITSPTRSAFIELVLSQLKQLRTMVLEDVTTGTRNAASNDGANDAAFDLMLEKVEDAAALPMDVDLPIMENSEIKVGENGVGEKDDERKNLINLCKTGLL